MGKTARGGERRRAEGGVSLECHRTPECDNNVHVHVLGNELIRGSNSNTAYNCTTRL